MGAQGELLRSASYLYFVAVGAWVGVEGVHPLFVGDYTGHLLAERYVNRVLVFSF